MKRSVVAVAIALIVMLASPASAADAVKVSYIQSVLQWFMPFLLFVGLILLIQRFAMRRNFNYMNRAMTHIETTEAQNQKIISLLETIAARLPASKPVPPQLPNDRGSGGQ